MAKQTIVILHGWQSKISRWQPLIKILKKKYQLFCPTLPGFGQDQLLKTWTLNDYCLWLKDYLMVNKIPNPTLLAHSFGGRIAIKFVAGGGEISRLILIASAGIKSRKRLKKTIFLLLAKIGKVFFSIPPFSFAKKFSRWLLYSLVREKDYYYASGFLKSTMQKIIEEDLEPMLTKIKIPTLIIWGAKDTYTPLADGKIMNQKIKNSHLAIFDNAKHDLPFTRIKKISELIFNFC